MVISNDLKATKLLNQQPLPLSSSLKFALFLCQNCRQRSLKPSSDLQTHTYAFHGLLETGGSGELLSKGQLKELGLLIFSNHIPPLCTMLSKERTCLQVSLPDQLLQ